jgi:hypothetical protein
MSSTLRGTQTKRRGVAGPVRSLLGGETHRPIAFAFKSWQGRPIVAQRFIAGFCRAVNPSPGRGGRDRMPARFRMPSREW